MLIESITSENVQIFKCYATEMYDDNSGEQALDKVITLIAVCYRL